MMNEFSLDKKVILVTGASSGIGKAIAIKCAEHGATVLLTARNEERLQGVCNSLVGEGHRYFVCDFAKDNQIEELVESLDQIDGFVNCAGINDKSLIKNLKKKTLQNVFDTNLFSPMLLVKNLVKKKKINKAASLVFISSISSTYATISNAMYASSKGAVNSLIRVLALELSSQKIRVNSILPGMVNTEMIHAYNMTDEELRTVEKEYPLGRFGEPCDIANAALFLLSDASSWMTGNAMVVDGGITLR